MSKSSKELLAEVNALVSRIKGAGAKVPKRIRRKQHELSYDAYVDDLMARYDTERTKREAAESAHGKIKCATCGRMSWPGRLHYPGGDPEAGPAHLS